MEDVLVGATGAPPGCASPTARASTRTGWCSPRGTAPASSSSASPRDGRVAIEAKPFAIGFRAEHPQGLIDSIQYGAAAQHPELPPADYKLAENFETGGEMRGVYSFCMCPGGIVVPTPTEDGLQCTNGMSNSRRNARYANAGIVVSVSPADFARAGFHGPLAGPRVPAPLGAARPTGSAAAASSPRRRPSPTTSPAGRARRPAATSYRPGLTHADLNVLFPPELTEAIKAALRRFDQKMRGFVSAEGKLIGIESRTSSPVRLPRDEALQSVSRARPLPLRARDAGMPGAS